MEFCPHCMRPATGPTCSSCGGQIAYEAGVGQLAAGSLLRGSNGHTYQIGAARGQGGFGITYAAMDLDNGERVAVKEYFPTRCAQRTQLNQVTPLTGQADTYQGGMKSFLEEAMMLSAVGAVPSVVTVKDYFESNGTAYLVMEFVDGVPLHQIVSQRGKLPAGELMPKVKSLLRDLDILHRAGVIHRDISPDNLIWQPNGTLKLLDFGSARSVQDGKSMTVLLKAGFSPVEQYRTRGQGPWTDVYALAATIYYCLTGVIPPSSIDRLDNDELLPPTALGCELSQPQEEALLWGLTVQPKSRPVSMDVFSQRLFADQAGGKPGSIPQPDFVQKAAEKAAELGKTIKATIETPKPETEPGTEPDSAPEPKSKSFGMKFKEFWARQFRSNSNAVGRKFLVLGIILAALLILAGVINGIVYLTTHGTTDDGFVYEIGGGEVSITGYQGSGGDVVIPGTIKKKPVTDIFFDAFDNGQDIASITIPDSVNWINSSAFDSCPNLKYIVMKGDKKFNDFYFTYCDALRCILYTDKADYENQLEFYDFSEKNIVLCYVGQETGVGSLKTVVVDDLGVVYAITYESTAVVLSLPDGVSADDLIGLTVNGLPIYLSDGTQPGEVVAEPTYGVTEDGYEYMITADGTQCHLTGYTGSEEYVYAPDDVDGVPVTVIVEGAFADNTTMESIWLPIDLELIEPDAFRGCSNLRDIYVYSDVTHEGVPFSGCARLRCVVRSDPELSVAGLGLPMDCKVYDYHMETGAGPLKYVTVMDSGVIYGIVDDDDEFIGVLMNVPASCGELTVSSAATWVYSGALDDVDEDVVIDITDSADLTFPPELLWQAEWTFNGEDLDQYTLAFNWLYSCMLADEITRTREDNVAIVPTLELVQAAMMRAEELSVSYEFTRPDGASSWSTLLDEYGVDWSSARTRRARLEIVDGDVTGLEDEMNDLIANYTPKSEEHDAYFTGFGAALYYDGEAGYVYEGCFAVIS